MKRLLLLIALVTAFACKKKETTPPVVETPPPTPPTVIVVSGSIENQNNSSFSAQMVISYQDGCEGGSVTVNGKSLGAHCPYSLNSTLTINNPVTWYISGFNTCPQQTIVVKDMPSMPVCSDMDTSKTLTASAGFTFHNQPIVCDSIEYIVCNMFKKGAHGNSTSMTFSPSELSGIQGALGLSTSLNMAITAYNYHIEVADNKRKVFVSKTTYLSVLHYKP